MDWSLYLVTDSELAGGRSLEEIVRAALEGGVGVVQYREKSASTRAMVEQASILARLCREKGACFLVNDRLDVALAVDADGVHLGQDDMPPFTARKLLGPGKLVGVTVHNEEEIAAAESRGADHLSLAPVFATSTKKDHQAPLGTEGLRKLVEQCRLPTVAIAGINASNASRVMAAGVGGICVASAVVGAEDPRRAAQELHGIVRNR